MIAVETLTPHEIDALELVAEGLSNKAVAVRLGISCCGTACSIGSNANWVSPGSC